jgi:predicted phage-related endonuclease
VKLHETEKELPKSLVVDSVKLTYIAPTTRSTIDTKKLKEEEPELAKKFTRVSDVSATVRIDGI